MSRKPRLKQKSDFLIKKPCNTARFFGDQMKEQIFQSKRIFIVKKWI